MRNSAIRREWERFVHAHQLLFEDYEKAWRRKLQLLKKFIDDRGGQLRPSKSSKDPDEKSIAKWISSQINAYNNHKNIMKDVSIRKKWEDFVHEYRELFEDTYKIKFRKKLQEVQAFIDAQNGQRRPWQSSQDKHERQLAKWLENRTQDYKHKAHIMKNPAMREEWEKFIDQNVTLFGHSTVALKHLLRDYAQIMEEISEYVL